ncbi:glutathione S-transferase family protein [Arenimonas sp.]|uniref:glutathione S-transferase family protein n=1 Tax=Arenimonas sp. TaxID=1872635 RepID=UPI0039E67539
MTFLIGMFDSPFVRRIAVSLDALGLPFEHRNWSVGRDFDRIREFNPLGRVPTLVLDSGEALIESSMILDHIDHQVGADRALLPMRGAARGDALRVMALATGAVDKALLIVMERVFRPAEKFHEPFVARCRLQLQGALAAIESLCAARGARGWLIGETMTQADITFACFLAYVREAVPFDLSPYPALSARLDRYQTLPLFARYHVPFDAPVPTT